MNYEVEKVIIRCPECKLIQVAEVGKVFPWNIYVHNCQKCAYVIMESEWDPVYDEEMDEIVLKIQENEIEALKLKLQIQKLKRKIVLEAAQAVFFILIGAFILYMSKS